MSKFFSRTKTASADAQKAPKKKFSGKAFAQKVQAWVKDARRQYRSLPTAPSSPLTILAGLCLAVGLCGMIATAYGLTTDLWLSLGIAAATALVLSLCAYRWQSFALFGGVCAATAITFLILLGASSTASAGMSWAWNNLLAFIRLDVREAYPEIVSFMAVLSGLVSGFVGGLSSGRRHIWLGLPAFVWLIFSLWSLGLSIPVTFAALTAFALIMIQLAAYQFPYLKEHTGQSLDRMLILTLPVAAVLVGACLWNAIVTTNYYHSIGLERRIHYTQDVFSVYAKNTPSRTPFSLARTGNRLFVNRLGGTVSPDPTTVLLHVESRHEMALKGAVYNEYTGNNWKDTTRSQRYALTSSNREKQKQVYDLEVMDEKLHVPYTFTTVEVEVSRASNNSALFVPFRVDTLEVDGFMTLYPFFNDKGEVFSTRNIEKGISYTIEAKIPDFDGVSFRRIWQNQAVKIEEDQAKIERIQALYTDLPETTPEFLVTLAQDLTRDCANELEAALAIRQYLAENFTYTLEVVEPDPQEDFVAHFFETGEGYCSYFASAMAVLARAAGLPSRYVEGYNLDTKGQLTTHFYLTAADSHAWAEVYVQGLGWVPMDPLVVEIYEADDSDKQNYQGTGISTAPEEEYDPYEEYVDILDDMEDLKVMEPVTLWERYLALWIALIVLIPPMILVPVLHPDARRYRAARQSLRGSMRWEYEEMMRILTCLNLPRKDGETLRSYAARVAPWVKIENPTIHEIMEQVSRFSYTPAKASLSDLRKLEAAHRVLKRYSRKVLGFVHYTRYIILRGSFQQPKPKTEKPARKPLWRRVKKDQ